MNRRNETRYEPGQPVQSMASAAHCRLLCAVQGGLLEGRDVMDILQYVIQSFECNNYG